MAEENELRYDPAAIESKRQQRWAEDPNFSLLRATLPLQELR
jgi:hypothetical protein